MILKRGFCSFVEKARLLSNVKYSPDNADIARQLPDLSIIANTDNNDLFPLPKGPRDDVSDCKLPFSLISRNAGEILLDLALDNEIFGVLTKGDARKASDDIDSTPCQSIIESADEIYDYIPRTLPPIPSDKIFKLSSIDYVSFFFIRLSFPFPLLILDFR